MHAQDVHQMVSENYHSKYQFKPILTLYHSELVWHGESEIASIISTAGIFRPEFRLDNLFDNNANSIWARNDDYSVIAELIIEFEMPIYFLRLILKKVAGLQFYKKICLRISELFGK